MFTTHAHIFKLGHAIGADAVLALNAMPAIWADGTVLNLLEQRFLLQRAFVCLHERFMWTENQVNNQPEYVGDQHKQRGEKPDHLVSGAGADVHERPDGDTEPDCQAKCYKDTDKNGADRSQH